MHWSAVLLLTLAIIVLPFVIGTWLGRRFRMPDHAWKIGLILFAISAGVSVCILGWPPKLGIDLSGGVILVYEVDQQALEPGQTVDMDKLVGAVARRVNPGGVKEVVIRPYGENQIEIIIPEADAAEVERIERKISSIGSLEFRIVANRIDHADLIEEALASPGRELRDPSGKVLARWVPVVESRAESYRRPQYATRTNRQNQLEVLVVMDDYNVTGQYLYNAAPGADERGRPAVKFTLTSEGGARFSRLTGDNRPDEAQGFERQLAIILDGFLQSSPNIQSVIYEQGQITGLDNSAEVEQIVEILNAGSLPTALQKEPISRLFTGPTLGADTIRRGTISMVVASAAVMIFMLVYYRFAGIVACSALIVNVVLTVAIMITIQAAFTLPGLAGLVLTVGMAVDANVLIYERMREELNRGASLKMAIRNGFDRAMSAIIDSNVTTLLTAVVLYAIGTDQIKGFAVTLFLGLVTSMFTAIFCARVVFEVAEKMRWITKLRMMQMVRTTQIDFVRMTPFWTGLSVVAIVLGLTFTVLRVQSSNLLDIDFTGGTSVQIQFLPDQPQRIADVRRTVESILPDVAVSDVQITGEQPGLRFMINTSDRSLTEVEDRLAQVYAGKLIYNELQFDDVAAIAPPAAVDSAPPQGPAPPTAPAAEPQSRRYLPGDETLLALADEPAGQAPAAPAVPTEEPAQGQDNQPAAAADEAPEGGQPAAAEPTNTEPVDTRPQAPSTPAAAESAAPAADGRPGDASPDGPGVTPGAEAGNDEAAAAELTDPFAGGAKAVLTFSEPMDHDSIVDLLAARFPSDTYPNVEIDATHDEYIEGSSAPSQTWTVKVSPPVTPERLTQTLDEIQAALRGQPFFPATSNIGGAVAANTQRQAIVAILASIVFMVAYIWIRFQRLTYGVAAATALVHDVLIALGALAASAYAAPYLGLLLIDPFKINLPIIAAFLTIVGYSINDTIVTFDRLREIKGKSPELTAAMVNQAINQTLARTLLTSLTVLITVVILYVWGGQGIHGFAFVLVVGSVAGVYSTVFIAAPIVLYMQRSTPQPTGKKRVEQPTAAA